MKTKLQMSFSHISRSSIRSKQISELDASFQYLFFCHIVWPTLCRLWRSYGGRRSTVFSIEMLRIPECWASFNPFLHKDPLWEILKIRVTGKTCSLQILQKKNYFGAQKILTSEQHGIIYFSEVNESTSYLGISLAISFENWHKSYLLTWYEILIIKSKIQIIKICWCGTCIKAASMWGDVEVW